MTTYWRQAGPDKWFAKDDAFDAALRARFLDLHFAAARRELDAHMATPEGALGVILLLDQIPRNVFRGGAHAYATDALALSLARAAVAAGHDRATADDLRVFFYLPYEHSERVEDLDDCVRLVEGWAAEPGRDAGDFLKWVHVHRDILVRFGRYPHRNAALGRETTAQERAFLDGGGFGG